MRSILTNLLIIVDQENALHFGTAEVVWIFPAAFPVEQSRILWLQGIFHAFQKTQVFLIMNAEVLSRMFQNIFHFNHLCVSFIEKNRDARLILNGISMRYQG